CWELEQRLLAPEQRLQCLILCMISGNSSRVHVHNVRVCYICIHVPRWCAAPINSSFTLVSSFSSM
uniref:Uncharacterized protein n=1 Tax=Macaca fascicularis TaxID=9541 RepID=A0A7N9IH29_MACFA